MIAKAAKTVFEAIEKFGHDEDFMPCLNQLCEPTPFPAGSDEKIEEMRRRVERGQPLWHPEDCREVCVSPSSFRRGAVQGNRRELPMLSCESTRREQPTNPSNVPTVAKQKIGKDGGVSLAQETREDGFPRVSEPAYANLRKSSHAWRTTQEATSQEASDGSLQVLADSPEASCHDLSDSFFPAMVESTVMSNSTGTIEAQASLRPPTESECRLIAAYRASVGSGIPQADFDRFMRELVEQGVDVSM